MEPSSPKSTPTLLEVALVFLRLGATAFGGPAAHIALMEDEFVRRRRWLTREHFLDLLGAVNVIPGPNSTEMAIHLGYLRAGWAGLVVAGVCFILPAAVLVLAIAWAYVEAGQAPRAAAVLAAILYGVKPVVIAVIAQALGVLGRTALKTWFLVGLGAGAAALSVLGINELAILFGVGAVAMLPQWGCRRGTPPSALLAVAAPAAGAAAASTPVSLPGIFFVFLKIGSVLFGSGYVLLAFLRADLVENRGWLTETQLLDAVAIGQVTPGPVFTTATFIGFLLAGPPGAAAATVGIFLPAFVFVALSGPWLPRLRQSPVAGAFLDGLNVASLSLMAVVAVQLTGAAVVDLLTALLALISAALLLAFRINATWLVLGGAVVGLLALIIPW